ncbi:MAG: ATP-dependent Clp protease ATP-binding subunit [Clostridiales bacterium]|nr:ATP-dependent Clp protease ATP-binding subunit [Clostridiales bacterium]
MQFPITDNLHKAIEYAQAAAKEYSNPVIGSEHILYGILKTESAAGNILRQNGLTEKILILVFEESDHVADLRGVDLSPRVKQTFIMAQQASQAQGSFSVSCEQLLYCLLQDPTSYAYTILANVAKMNVSGIMRALSAAMEGRQESNTQGGKSNVGTLPPQLADLGIDMTQRAREHKIDPIIGRKGEIERIIEILCRKTKNNPVLIGEPGVGKSAVVEGLCKAIVEGSVPELLRNKIVFSLDLGSLMAGTKYRGALEEKLKNAIDTIKSQQNIIVFIDELHTLAQAGSKEGEVSPADILKPYLARGEMQTIGATTTDEYRKFIETDKALERRFQPIIVDPPSVDDTIEILRGLRENYEAFHKVKISDDALVAAAKLSDRYITDRFLPDKAIDLIDEAMSKAKVSGNTAPAGLKELEEEIRQCEQKKREAIFHEDFLEAGKLRDKLKQLNASAEEMKLTWSKNTEYASGTIGPEQIAEVVSKWTKIPVTKLTESETQRLVHLEEELHKRVIGQDGAVVAVSKAIRRARAGLKDANRPIGTFLFLGPTGVGKTELTKALGQAMFDDENAVIRLDMSEYMESHSVSKLIGAPPGYVGFDDGGQLTEQVRRKPYSVVLFDEIEKAHPDVYNALLQILDDGRMTDGQGRTVSFKNTIIIMTSNVGVEDLKANRSLGFSSLAADAPDEKRTEEVLTEALKRRFKPEFINRIDVVSIFHHLAKDDIRKIALIMLGNVEKSLADRGITLDISEAAMDAIVTRGYDPEYGARPLRRVIEQCVEDAIAEAILDGRVHDGVVVKVGVRDGEITVSQ